VDVPGPHEPGPVNERPWTQREERGPARPPSDERRGAGSGRHRSSGGVLLLGRRLVLEILDLALEELDVADGLVEHGGGVHLGASRDEALQDADALADPLPPLTGGDALRVFADAHVAAARLLDGGRVDVHRLHRRDPVHHLLHRAKLLLHILHTTLLLLLLGLGHRLLFVVVLLRLLAVLVLLVPVMMGGSRVDVEAQMMEAVLRRRREERGRRRRVQAGMMMKVVVSWVERRMVMM
jgi:hypothetical protein